MEEVDPALTRSEHVSVPSCHVLRTIDEARAAELAARGLRLAAHPQWIKYWDNMLAVRLIADLGLESDDAIADLGCRSGILLTWLDQLGYRDLYGCDLQAPFPPIRSALRAGQWLTAVAGGRMYLRHRRRMVRAPVEQTGLPGGRYSVLTSMSVIEHGVDTPQFFAEAARLLRPGGTLILSTDYWPTPIDLGSLQRVAGTRGQDRIFDKAAVTHLCQLAEAAGFVAPTDPDLDPGDPVVSYSGFRYTFLALAFARVKDAVGTASG